MDTFKSTIHIEDFKTSSLCDKCGNSHLCMYKKQFEDIRSKLIELTSPTEVQEPLIMEFEDGVVDESTKHNVTQEVAPELNLSNGIYLHMTCCNYRPNINYRQDPFISPFKP